VKLGFAIRTVARKFFGIECDYIGYVNHDEKARQSVRDRRPLVETYPRSDAAIYLTRIAKKLIQDSDRRN
jgi:MinD-like ATPase involved in chromosome partitioning or flagellar assembly